MTERYKPDMSVIHHSHMLNDKVRIDKYKKQFLRRLHHMTTLLI